MGMPWNSGFLNELMETLMQFKSAVLVLSWMFQTRDGKRTSPWILIQNIHDFTQCVYSDSHTLENLDKFTFNITDHLNGRVRVTVLPFRVRGCLQEDLLNLESLRGCWVQSTLSDFRVEIDGLYLCNS